jgi:DNA-binding NarL/FixJ family response regulator
VTIRALIVDDDPTFLEAATELLEEEGITMVGAASSSAEAEQEARRLRPDVVLIDVELGDESGFDLARQLAAANGMPPITMIMISTYSEDDFVDLIAASPARGFVSKYRVSAAAITDLLEDGDGCGPVPILSR